MVHRKPSGDVTVTLSANYYEISDSDAVSKKT